MSVISEILEGVGEAAAVRGEPRAASQPAAMAGLLERLGAAATNARHGVQYASRPARRTEAFLAEREQLVALAVEVVRAIESLDANELALHHKQRRGTS